MGLPAVVRTSRPKATLPSGNYHQTEPGGCCSQRLYVGGPTRDVGVWSLNPFNLTRGFEVRVMQNPSFEGQLSSPLLAAPDKASVLSRATT